MPHTKCRRRSRGDVASGAASAMQRKRRTRAATPPVKRAGRLINGIESFGDTVAPGNDAPRVAFRKLNNLRDASTLENTLPLQTFVHLGQRLLKRLSDFCNQDAVELVNLSLFFTVSFP